tara:strand:- start:577 stop:870 length:294 start_codon:yes stop_codon:yes gene_type:complete
VIEFTIIADDDSVSNFWEKGDKSPLELPNKNKSTTEASSQQTWTGSASTASKTDDSAKIDEMNSTDRSSVDDLLLPTTCYTGHSFLITYTTIFSQKA